MPPDAIAEYLVLAPSERVVMGTPTGTASPATHPFHIVTFRSHLPPSARMEAHIEHMLSVVEPLKSKLAAIQERCRPVIFCGRVSRGEGGWELSLDLLTRMASLGIAFCFSLDEPRKLNVAS